MSKRLLLFSTGILLFLLFVLFSYFVHRNIFNEFDFDTTVRLQNHISRRFDSMFSVLSLIGSFEVISVFLIILMLIYHKWKGLIALAIYISIHLFELFGKIFVTHPGPPFIFLRYNIGFSFPSSYVQPGSSYPSGHSARASFLMIIIIFMIYRSKKLSIHLKIGLISLAIVFALSMFVSRVYLAEHWTTDVIGGAFLGLSLGLVSIAML